MSHLDLIKKIIHENEGTAVNCIGDGAVEKFDPILQVKDKKKKSLNSIIKRTPFQDIKGTK